MDAKDKRLLEEYYKRRLYGGRRRLARAVDYIALRAVLLLSCYLWFAAKLPNVTLCVILSLVATGLFCTAAGLYKSIRLDKFRETERQRLREAHARERLLLCPARAYGAMVRAYAQAHASDFPGSCLVCPLQRSEPLGADALLFVYRLAQERGCESVALFCPAPMTKEARQLARRTDIAVKLQSPAVFCRIAQEQGMATDDEQIEQNILAEMRREKEARKDQAAPFVSGRVKRYLLVAAGLFAASFFVRYALYYRLMAGLCLSFAATAWWLSRTTVGSSAPHDFGERS